MGNWAHMKWSQVLLFCNESMTVSALGACMPPARGPSGCGRSHLLPSARPGSHRTGA